MDVEDDDHNEMAIEDLDPLGGEEEIMDMEDEPANIVEEEEVDLGQ